jgi:hypothetical protein
MARSPRPTTPSQRARDRAFTATTGAIKLGGFIIAMNEALIESERSPEAFLLAAFMMAGAQGLDELLTAWRGRA